MRKDNTNDERGGKPNEGTKAEVKSCCEGGTESSASCGDSMKEMMRACPCGDKLRSHRLAVYTTLVGIGLGLLILPAGWILGVIAFFRTF